METTNVTKKEVTFVTPVLFKPWICDQISLNKKITYSKNALLHELKFPPQITTLDNCMIIDLPLEDIEKFINDYLQWLPLKSDSVLLSKLNSYLSSISTSKKQTECLRHLGILSTPLL
jgi:hypothetical protein